MALPRILFMGTPSFALPALKKLHDRNYPLIGVVTQPDRAQGRGQKEVAPPVKIFALKIGLPVFQPETVKAPSFLELFHHLNPEMVVVAAFGQILPEAIINFPPLKCLNIHPSLLPAYRGAAPINWAIIHGDIRTGVTIMLMDKGMDSGNILLQQETEIGNTETFGKLHDRLANEGAELLIAAIDLMVAGNVSPRPQNSAEVTFAPRLKKETGRICWNSSAAEIVNLIRGLSPIPAAYTFLSGQVFKIFSAEAINCRIEIKAGTIADLTDRGLAVAAADGYVFLREVQLAGKKRMSIWEFLRGRQLSPETILG